MNWRSIYIISILFTSCQNNEGINNPKKRNENWCWFVDNKTKQGKWIPLSDESTATLSHGDLTTFYFNGNIRTQGKLKNHELVDTNKVFDLHGKQITCEIHKKDTIIYYYLNNGSYKRHFSNGKIMVEGVVENHKKGHYWKQYYEDGKPELIINIRNGIKTENWYFNNGLLESSYRKKNDKYHGLNKDYYINGKLLCSSFFINGKRHGEYYSYYGNGQLKVHKTYNYGLMNGECTKYYENGNLQSVKTFINDTIHGTEIFYYESGGIKKIGPVIKGKFEGEWKEYLETGELKQTSIFKNNQFQGIKKYH